MIVFFWVFAGIVALAVAGFVWGYVRLKRNSTRLAEAIAAVKLEEIPTLAGTCAHVFASKLERPLDASDPLECVRTLDRTIPTLECWSAFSRSDLEWAYVLHCGAYLGELLRMHAGGRWEMSADGGPEMVMGEGEGLVRTWPFEKILKHRMQGDPGDLIAYFEVARRGPDVIVAAATGTQG